jgi:hypothetical protein
VIFAPTGTWLSLSTTRSVIENALPSPGTGPFRSHSFVPVITPSSGRLMSSSGALCPNTEARVRSAHTSSVGLSATGTFSQAL